MENKERNKVEVISYDKWLPYEGFAEGSGRSEKIWLQSATGEIGLFKYPKLDPETSEITTEHISEHLAHQIGNILGIQSAHVEIGTYNGRIGSMSYQINKEDEAIIEGATFIAGLHPDFDLNLLQETSTGRYYCFDHFLEISDRPDFIKNWLQMMIFDYVIGNADRHQSNWAILFKYESINKYGAKVSACPLYDNGSSLCCYVNENAVKEFLGKDTNRFDALVDTKSRSMIRIDGSSKKRPTHADVVRELLKKYPDARDFCETVTSRMTESVINDLLDAYDGLLSNGKAELIKRFLLRKVEMLTQIQMEVRNMREHNFLYLIWKDPKTRRNYTVGKLQRTEKGYSFEYCNEYKEAQEAGWELIQAFKEEKKYESSELFLAFASRLPDKKRRNINQVLQKYGLSEYDGYELLKKSGGKLPIDMYEFIDPIFDEDKTIERDFYVVGIRHLSECNGKDCGKLPQLQEGDNLVLKMEPTNAYDSYAVQVETESGESLGYVPRYYSRSVTERLKSGMSYECTVLENDETNCQECLKVKLRMPKKGIL